MISGHEPIFVLGNPRSGTTLLRLLLTSHPHVVIPPEAGFVCWLYGEYGDWGRREWADEASLRRFCAAVAESRKFETWGLGEAVLLDRLGRGAPTSYAEACALIYEAYARANKPEFRRWGDKNNYYTAHVDLLDALYPDARFVHIVRDPRDVACSYLDMNALQTDSAYRPNLPSDAGDIARSWARNVGDVRRSFAALDDERTYTLRYEALVADPEAQLRALFGRLGEPYDDEVLLFYKYNRERELEPRKMLAWKEMTLKPISTARTGRYTSMLSVEEQYAILEIAGDLMQAFGYEPVPQSA